MLSTEIGSTQREWEDLAHVDPHWAILSDQRKQFGHWDRDEFFESGQGEIDSLMVSCGLRRGDHGAVLDFGCGIGRLSRALRPYFSRVYGVDISSEMIRMAKEHTPACEFILNRSEDLRVFPNNFFDFVYSSIVLQHQAKKTVVQSYIREFVRIVKPHGTIVFQMPHRLAFRSALQPRRRLYAVLRTVGFTPDFLYNQLHLSPMRTISLSTKGVRSAVCEAGGSIVRCYPDNLNRNSMTYVVQKVAMMA
jgi:2-polyprenyl-3-methyl-5-hydroxy-6-metoxy-1,4-benzoquinol methylase